MRQTLLGSTSLAAIGLVASDGMAADDGVKLSIGGWYHAAAGAIVDEDFSASSGVSGGDVRAGAFKQNVGISFSGESTLDNGLTVGAYVELRGQTRDDQIRKVYVYFSGSFGKVQFSDQDGALAAMCYTVPSASQVFGADSPAVYGFNFSNAGLVAMERPTALATASTATARRSCISVRTSTDSSSRRRSRRTKPK